jgi:cell shape-determining protein MreD
MFFRGLAYVLIGWLAMATVGSAGHILHVSVMLPSTSAVQLAIAAVLGYLEDLHQGAPLGTLMLAHQLCFLALHWAAGRLALHGWLSRAGASLVAVALIDGATWATLMVLAEPLRLPRDALTAALWQSRWHMLATFLVAHPIWLLTDSLMRALRIERPKPTGETEAGA